MYNEEIMDRAASIAKEGIEAGCGGPFGCVIVKDGEIIAEGHNSVVRDNDPTAHGEVNAIRNAGKKLNTFNLKGCELYTTSEPCPMCLASIMWARIDKVYTAMTIKDAKKIGFDDEPFYNAMEKYINKEQNEYVEVEQVENKNCIEVFDEYDKMEGKILY